MKHLFRSVVAACAIACSTAWALPPCFIAGDFDTALATAKKEDKLVLLYLYSERIDAVTHEPRKADLCERVEEQVLGNPDLLKAFSSMVCVAASVDAGDNRRLLGRLDLEPAYPTFAWVDTDESVLAVLGACFTPSAYVAFTQSAGEIRGLRRKTEPTIEDQLHLGGLYFDTGRYAQSAELLRRMLVPGVGSRGDRITCAFALRKAGENEDAIAALNEVLTACQAREPEPGEVNLGPTIVPLYDPIAFEREGQLAGILHALSPAREMTRIIDDLEWALTTTPSTPEEWLRAARVFYDRENWARAAAAYEQALAGAIAPDAKEECAARAGTAALRAGDGEMATKAFDRYLEDYKGPHRPEVLFYQASLLLAPSIDMTRIDEHGRPAILNQKAYNRAGDLLLEVVTSYRSTDWAAPAGDLLKRFYRKEDDDPK